VGAASTGTVKLMANVIFVDPGFAPTGEPAKPTPDSVVAT